MSSSLSGFGKPTSRSLVHKRLGMVQGLAEKAVEWCAGSPMMAHQLIESWHTEGQLVPSAEGIAHRQLEQIALSDRLRSPVDEAAGSSAFRT